MYECYNSNEKKNWQMCYIFFNTQPYILFLFQKIFTPKKLMHRCMSMKERVNDFQRLKKY
jgi:hypothetical protein